MDIILCPNAEEASLRAAALITNAVRARPATVLGLATGSTPLRLYQALIQACRDGLDFSRVRTFNLDEYYGVSPDHPQSYRRFMNEHLFNHLNLKPANTHVPDGLARDVAAHCAAYEAEMRAAGGVDIQVLGIGRDGHIGFNEPGGSLSSTTHTQVLTEQTRKDNARFFDGDIDLVPRYCITQGLATISRAKAVVLVAQGEQKADAIAALAEGGVSALWPASVLQFHNDATILVDESAASKLGLKDYYKAAYEGEVALSALKG